MIDKIKSLMSLPPLTSRHGAGVDDLILYTHYLMAALFVIWIVYFFYALFRFSARRNPKASYDGYTGKTTTHMEIGVAVIEGVLLIGLAIPLWARAADGFPADKDATVIRVIAQQFAWNSRYPGADGKFGPQDLKHLSTENRFGVDKAHADSADDVVPALNDLAVPFEVLKDDQGNSRKNKDGSPMHRGVILHITSMDVIHSFAVHPIRLTQDAIPGVSIPTHFTPTQPGDYQITCAQLCGNSHYFMKGFLKVVTPEKYTEWLAKQPKLRAAAAFE